MADVTERAPRGPVFAPRVAAAAMRAADRASSRWAARGAVRLADRMAAKWLGGMARLAPAMASGAIRSLEAPDLPRVFARPRGDGDSDDERASDVVHDGAADGWTATPPPAVMPAAMQLPAASPVAALAWADARLVRIGRGAPAAATVGLEVALPAAAPRSAIVPVEDRFAPELDTPLVAGLLATPHSPEPVVDREPIAAAPTRVVAEAMAALVAPTAPRASHVRELAAEPARAVLDASIAAPRVEPAAIAPVEASTRSRADARRADPLVAPPFAAQAPAATPANAASVLPAAPQIATPIAPVDSRSRASVMAVPQIAEATAPVARPVTAPAMPVAAHIAAPAASVAPPLDAAVPMLAAAAPAQRIEAPSEQGRASVHAVTPPIVRDQVVIAPSRDADVAARATVAAAPHADMPVASLVDTPIVARGELAPGAPRLDLPVAAPVDMPIAARAEREGAPPRIDVPVTPPVEPPAVAPRPAAPTPRAERVGRAEISASVAPRSELPAPRADLPAAARVELPVAARTEAPVAPPIDRAIVDTRDEPAIPVHRDAPASIPPARRADTPVPMPAGAPRVDATPVARPEAPRPGRAPIAARADMPVAPRVEAASPRVAGAPVEARPEPVAAPPPALVDPPRADPPRADPPRADPPRAEPPAIDARSVPVAARTASATRSPTSQPPRRDHMTARAEQTLARADAIATRNTVHAEPPPHASRFDAPSTRPVAHAPRAEPPAERSVVAPAAAAGRHGGGEVSIPPWFAAAARTLFDAPAPAGPAGAISLAELTLVVHTPATHIAAATRAMPAPIPTQPPAAATDNGRIDDDADDAFDIDAIARDVYAHLLALADHARIRNGLP
jgi:nicotinate-nucleotide--dimethylbenzimidazole phosphoribosyltransferase